MACDAFSVHIYKMKSTAYLCNCSTAQPNIHNLCEILNILSIQRAIKDCRRGAEQKVTKFPIQMSNVQPRNKHQNKSRQGISIQNFS